MMGFKLCQGYFIYDCKSFYELYKKAGARTLSIKVDELFQKYL